LLDELFVIPELVTGFHQRHVGVDAQQPITQRFFETGHHRHHDVQRHHADHDTQH
jgi:hypothetical protein